MTHGLLLSSRSEEFSNIYKNEYQSFEIMTPNNTYQLILLNIINTINTTTNNY